MCHLWDFNFDTKNVKQVVKFPTTFINKVLLYLLPCSLEMDSILHSKYKNVHFRCTSYDYFAIVVKLIDQFEIGWKIIGVEWFTNL